MYSAVPHCKLYNLKPRFTLGNIPRYNQLFDITGFLVKKQCYTFSCVDLELRNHNQCEGMSGLQAQWPKESKESVGLKNHLRAVPVTKCPVCYE